MKPGSGSVLLSQIHNKNNTHPALFMDEHRR